VRIDPEQRSIQGEVVMSADLVTPSDSIVLDLDSRLTVDSVVMEVASAGVEM
jgi:hypothetical protein